MGCGIVSHNDYGKMRRYSTCFQGRNTNAEFMFNFAGARSPIKPLCCHIKANAEGLLSVRFDVG
jgi:hypothetical protein